MSLVCLSDYEERAAELLPKKYLDYFRSGAGNLTTIQLNRDAYTRLRLRPKCLQDVSNMNTSTNVLGFDMSMPVGIAPTAFHKLAHWEGELATARAAEKAGVVFTLSILAMSSIEEVAKAAPNATKWLQIYMYKQRWLTEQHVRKAEENGFKAIVLTVDSPVYNRSYALRRNTPWLPPNFQLSNFPEPGSPSTFETDTSMSWDDVKWLVNSTKLPVIAKGILRAADAIKAIVAGCRGIIVSNHGGRALDTTPATIEALPEIVEAVSGLIPVIIDGGITLGTDVLKALALGANMVLLGRPLLWGLAVNGQQGAEEVLSFIQQELETTMKLCGAQTVKDIKKDLVVHESYYMEKMKKY